MLIQECFKQVQFNTVINIVPNHSAMEHLLPSHEKTISFSKMIQLWRLLQGTQSVCVVFFSFVAVKPTTRYWCWHPTQNLVLAIMLHKSFGWWSGSSLVIVVYWVISLSVCANHLHPCVSYLQHMTVDMQFTNIALALKSGLVLKVDSAVRFSQVGS